MPARTLPGHSIIFSPVYCTPSPAYPEQLSYSQYRYTHCSRHYLPHSAFWVTSLSTNTVSLRHPGYERAANNISSFTGKHSHFTVPKHFLSLKRMLASYSYCKGTDCCLGTVTISYPALVSCLVVSSHVKTGPALL